MNRRYSRSIWVLLIALIASLMFYGCADSDSDSDDSSDVATKTITGTAASGLPIVGIVSVMGANGATASATIDTNGDYTLDVTALTAPYILRAEGTVGDESLELFSTGVAAGHINITPITNLIASKVIDLGTAFDSWSTASASVDTAAIEAAETKVQTQLAPILEAYGIADDIDLMSVDFDTDQSGLDAVLDVVKIEIDDSNNVTITNTATGTSVTGEESFSEDEKTTMASVISDTAGMNIFWNRVTTLYATSRPSADQVNSQIAPLVADDYMSGGRDKNSEMSCWISGECMPTGAKFKLAIDKAMTAEQYGSYQKGYWVKIAYELGASKGVFKAAMVYNGTNWLWFGNRMWIDYWFKIGASRTFASDGSDPTYMSELHLNINDNQNYAYNHGIRFALLKGPGLPNEVNGARFLTQWSNYPDDEFANGWMQITDDDTANLISANPTYLVLLFETNNFGGTDPLQAYNINIPGKALKPSEVTAGLFPTLINPTSHSLSDLNIGGPVSLAWDNPSTCTSNWLALEWGDGSSQLEVKKEFHDGAESVTLDTSSNNMSSVSWATFRLECVDLSGRVMTTEWKWQ